MWFFGVSSEPVSMVESYIFDTSERPLAFDIEPASNLAKRHRGAVSWFDRRLQSNIYGPNSFHPREYRDGRQIQRFLKREKEMTPENWRQYTRLKREQADQDTQIKKWDLLREIAKRKVDEDEALVNIHNNSDKIAKAKAELEGQNEKLKMTREELGEVEEKLERTRQEVEEEMKKFKQTLGKKLDQARKARNEVAEKFKNARTAVATAEEEIWKLVEEVEMKVEGRVGSREMLDV